MNKKICSICIVLSLISSCLPTNTVFSENEISEIYEAEDGECIGNVKANQNSYVSGFESNGDYCTISVTIANSGFYDLVFFTKSLDGHKENYVLVDDNRIGLIYSDSTQFEASTVRQVYLETGKHSVTISSYWGYIAWDKLKIIPSDPFNEDVFNVSPVLSNKNAEENTKRLYSFLCDEYGKHIISGQYCDTGMNGWESLRISETTGGKFPAILGLDMAYYSQTGLDHGANVKTTDQALACWKKGGIITLCWHWLAPKKFISGTWYGAFRSSEVNMNLGAVLDGKDPEGYRLILQDIKNIAEQLLIMQEAGVPILWRPLHEASGGWFWWGSEGPEVYKKLYILLYDTLTHEYGLNNLIWVWNGQDKAWYPGDEYVDIVGIDVYAGEHEYASQIESFLTALDYSDSNKMVVLSENGTMIDPDFSVRDRALWGYFCTWGGEFVIQDGLKKKYSEQYTDAQMLKKVYTSDLIITRDELPDLLTYPIRSELQQ